MTALACVHCQRQRKANTLGFTTLLVVTPSSNALSHASHRFRYPFRLLKERCALLGELWSADIRAETLHKAAPSLKESYEYAGLRGARWLVLLEDSSLSMADSVRLKHLAAFGRLAGKEEVVARGEVARYLSALACPAPGGAAGGAGGGRGGGGGAGPSKVRIEHAQPLRSRAGATLHGNPLSGGARS